jgi:hypothetical protein
MGQTLALADAVLKDDYQGPIRKQINDDCRFTNQAIKNTKDLVGRRAVLPLHMTRNVGIGARLEGEVLPVAGNQGTTTQIINLRSNYGRMRLSRQVISRMESDRGAFTRAIELETEGLRSDSARDYNRQSWGTSDGVVATCGTTTASATVQLALTTPEQVMVNIAEGMRVDIGITADPQSVAANRSVTAVDITNRTITISGGTVTTSSSNYVFRQGSGGTGANQRELTGAQTMISDSGTLFDVNPVTYFQWKSIVEGNGAVTRPLSENLVMKASMRAEQRSGKKVDQLWAEDGVYRAGINLLTAQKRFVNETTVKGGAVGVEFATTGEMRALMHDRDAPVGKIYGVCTSELVEFVDEDWQFEDLDGSVLQRATDSTHAFEAIWFKFSEFATVRRNAHFRIDDLEQA